jgi:hypothetical protein
MTSIDTTNKPFLIEKRQVCEAYKAVKSNKGAAGVDGQTIEQFEADLGRNLPVPRDKANQAVVWLGAAGLSSPMFAAVDRRGLFVVCRHMIRPLLTCVIIAILMSSSAEAQMMTYMIGAGMDSCGTWTADRRNPRSSDAQQDQQWVLGFLSGIGYQGDINLNPLNGMDANGVLAWIDNYCQAHPIDKIKEAAAMFRFAHPH